MASTDRVLGLQGGAGTGKTTALSVIREAAEKEGYQVRGFAPTTRAALIYTDSAENLRDTLNRSTNKVSAIDATRDSLLDLRKELDKLRGDPLAPQQQPSTEHSLTQTPTHTGPAPTKAAEPEIEGPEIDLGGLIR